MRASKVGADVIVRSDNNDRTDFNRQWPGSDVPCQVSAIFDPNGDLVGLHHNMPDHYEFENGRGMSEFIDDMKQYAKNRGLLA